MKSQKMSNIRVIVKQYGSKFLILLNHEQHFFKLLSP